MNERELLARVRRLELRAGRLADALSAGATRSVLTGQGLDFEELRPYGPGDDVRAIDWNATARTGSVYVKSYRDERAFPVWVLLDVSASMHFGSPPRTKRALALELAATLLVAAERQGERSGLILFSDRIEHRVFPRREPGHTLRLLRDMLLYRPRARTTALEPVLHPLVHALPARSHLFVVTDTHATGGERALQALSRRHDLMVLRVMDPCELELRPSGLLALADPETGAARLIDTDDGALRRAFATRARKELAASAARLEALGVPVLDLRTDEPPLPRLQAALARPHRFASRR